MNAGLKTIQRMALIAAALSLEFAVISAAQSAAPQPDSNRLNTRGQIVIDGQVSPYIIRRLPVTSFPDLPESIQTVLDRRGCLVPQTYEAHHPENVIRGSFEDKNSSDWAVLCSANGTVSLLVFFTSRDPDDPFTIASAPETERLHARNATNVLGFDWAIDPATPNQVRDAQATLPHRPPAVDHDALADSTVDGRTIYHFYAKSNWTQLEMP